MQRYFIWDKSSSINGVSAKKILNEIPFRGYEGDIILIFSEDNTKITNIECKDIIAEIYNIDKNLEINEFMDIYFNKLKVLQEQSENSI